jgi:hypothetical protein
VQSREVGRPGTECWSMAHQQAMIIMNEQSYNTTAWQRFKGTVVTKRDLKYGRAKIVKLRMIHAYLVNYIRQTCTLVMMIVKNTRNPSAIPKRWLNHGPN